MKKIKILIILFLTSFVCSAVYSQEITTIETEDGNFNISHWGDAKDFKTFSLNHEYEDTLFTTEISLSDEGKKGIYFKINNRDRTTCDFEDYEIDEVYRNWYFNDQAIKMLLYCNEYNDGNGKYLSATSESDKGDAFVLSLFKNSSESMTIRTHEGYIIMVSAIGFTAEWNKRGEDAF